MYFKTCCINHHSNQTIIFSWTVVLLPKKVNCSKLTTETLEKGVKYVKATQQLSMALFCCLYCYIWKYLTLFSTVTVAKFEKVFICCLFVFIKFFEHGLWNVKSKYHLWQNLIAFWYSNMFMFLFIHFNIK